MANYYVKDEYGVILVQYAGSKFETQGSTDLVHQRRDVHLALTIIARSPAR
ncbi:Gp37 family protein [Avibacterium paragallinarum]|uniref:Gp37 family protein n=1 Tax=Avibacterium paragallinarum TaxID=728 RepID=UPI002114E677|nr:Gp37 family protein [Avibacterium paragallinarum]